MAEKFSPEDLVAWRKDPRGEPFWTELQNMFASRVSALRSAVRLGDDHLSAIRCGELDNIEEVLQLTDVLIQEQKAEEDDKAKEEEAS